MTQSRYIFIGGSVRTGSTLLREILNCSEEVAICEETHFFAIRFVGYPTRPGFRDIFKQIGDISTRVGAEKVTDYIYSDQMRSLFGNWPSFWGWLRENIDLKEFLARLLESDRSDRALFDLCMALYANGKPIRGEKTPAHIHHVSTILQWFPNAKFIHTLRDPRAILASVRKRAKRSDYGSRRYRAFRLSGPLFEIFLARNVITNWITVVRLHHQYQQLHPNRYCLCRFEDLVADPETRLRGMCSFLEITFMDAMLRPPIVDSSFLPRGDQTRGFDTKAIDRWRTYLHPLAVKLVNHRIKAHLPEFGYRP